MEHLHSPIIILVSADAEWRCVRARFPDADVQPSPLGEWFLAPELDVIFFHGGWGKIRAAASAQYVIGRWSPALLINIGTCGGFAGEIELGAFVLARHTVVYDIYEQMADAEEAIAAYATEIDLSWVAGDDPAGVERGVLVSGDRDLWTDDIPKLRSVYGAKAGDWESGAIAYVAARNGVRCLILRGVSDLVGSDGGAAYGDGAQQWRAATEGIMTALLEALPDWISRIGEL
ncbi:MAG: 5'-methylthioadenosine/S-adenosylhomocysteine nucleosidase [Capsulimonas sp.]|uniref:5'-methylthioadenosine/S-adenosylhomocysteine nucleosidase family protein n=1 Tax=Capsulimonas sp. TaxID=2494211 RepID=UPI003263AF80